MTATPTHDGRPILENQNDCLVFDFPRQLAIDRGIIRPLEFEEVGNFSDAEDARITAVVARVIQRLTEQRAAHGRSYQALILTYQKEEADGVVQRANELRAGVARSYHSGTDVNPSRAMDGNLAHFKNGNVWILVVCGKLLEGFDHKQVSVVASQCCCNSAEHCSFIQSSV